MSSGSRGRGGGVEGEDSIAQGAQVGEEKTAAEGDKVRFWKQVIEGDEVHQASRWDRGGKVGWCFCYPDVTGPPDD